MDAAVSQNSTVSSIKKKKKLFSSFRVSDLFRARVHLGHTPRSLTPQMRPFIYGTRFDVCVFDLVNIVRLD
jgi:ribosomal protein S2